MIKNRYNRKLSICFMLLALVLTVCFCHPVNAAPEKGDTMTVYYQCKEQQAALTVHIYYVADVKIDSMEFTPAGDFTELCTEEELAGIQMASDNAELSEELWKKVGEKEIRPLRSKETDQDGKVIFSGLSPGLYLLAADDREGVYTAPVLICMPQYEEESGQWLKNVTVYAKVRYSETPEEPMPEELTPEEPMPVNPAPEDTKADPAAPFRNTKTGDDAFLWQYTAAAAISSLLTVLLLWNWPGRKHSAD